MVVSEKNFIKKQCFCILLIKTNTMKEYKMYLVVLIVSIALFAIGAHAETRIGGMMPYIAQAIGGVGVIISVGLAGLKFIKK